MRLVIMYFNVARKAQSGTTHRKVLPSTSVQSYSVALSQSCSSRRRSHLETIKMRLTSILFRNGRKPQNEKKVPFKAMTPMVLKNYVTSGNRKASEHGCLYEVSLLLTCLEENENEDKNCIPQFNLLSACYEKYNQKVLEHTIQSGNKIPVPNSKHQTCTQVSYLLRKYKI